MEILGIQIKVIKSKRKSISLQIKRDGSVVVKAPLLMSENGIKKFVLSKEKWLKTHLNKKESLPKFHFSVAEIEQMKKQAKLTLVPMLNRLNTVVKVQVNGVHVHAQKSLWGSCTVGGEINLNCLLIKVPTAVAEYVIIHELCHRKQMNHSTAFWDEVKKYCPNYKACRKWLKDNGSAYLSGIER